MPSMTLAKGPAPSKLEYLEPLPLLRCCCSVVTPGAAPKQRRGGGGGSSAGWCGVSCGACCSHSRRGGPCRSCSSSSGSCGSCCSCSSNGCVSCGACCSRSRCGDSCRSCSCCRGSCGSCCSSPSSGSLGGAAGHGRARPPTASFLVCPSTECPPTVGAAEKPRLKLVFTRRQRSWSSSLTRRPPASRRCPRAAPVASWPPSTLRGALSSTTLGGCASWRGPHESAHTAS